MPATPTTPETMTPRGGGAPVELDLNSFLRSHGGDLFSSSSSEDDDDDAATVRRRTVDEILLGSDVSASSSSSTSRSPSPPKALTATPNPNHKVEEEQPKIAAGEQRPNLEPQEESSTSFDWRRRSRELSTSTSTSLPPFALRSYASGGATSSASSRPLSSLFGGVRPNPKPGAALAAAAAASRTVPTPHATAIKIRRASIGSASKVSQEQALVSEESVSSEELDVSELSEGNNVSAFMDIFTDERKTMKSSSWEGKQMAVLEELQAEVAPEGDDGDQSAKEVESAEKLDTTVLPGTTADGDSMQEDENSLVTEEANAIDENRVVDSNECKLEVAQVPMKLPQVEGDDVNGEIYPDKEVFTESEYTQAEETDIDRLVEETLAQLENSKKAVKKAEKKLRASMKPLEWAEELEKRNASSGLHWEEGAAAQPMRLEGIRRGPPAVGYMQMDLDNAITRALSTQSIKRDHGSPQVVAVHMNYIALGMLKGTVLVFPSKYSAHSADSMESKMLIFGSHGEKSQTPVTSMCFNQQGNLLLVGYNDGHVTLWDVQRALPAKVITGEHVAPVVHTFFLGQDPEITRQFKMVTGDCKGLVLLHAVSVVPLVNHISINTQCLFDGQKTATVLAACPLLIDDSGGFGYSSAQGNTTTSTNGLGSMVGGVVGVVGKDAGWKLFNEGSSVMEEGVVIFVTHQNALVVKLSPTVEVFEKLSRPDGVREGSVPYAAWRWTTSTHHISHESSDRVSWLAIAWDRKVQVTKLVKSDLKRHREWNLDGAALGVTWLDDQMLVVLTQKGHVCLFSKDGSEIHRTSFLLGGLGIDDIITYNTHFANNFGNPEKAYHKCTAVRGATIYILGPLHLMVSRLLPWKERIQVLQRAGDWMGALDMSMRLYDGHAHGVIDLPVTVDAIRDVIMPFLVELILSYVDEVFSYISVALCNQIGKLGLLENQESPDNTLRTEIENQYGRVGGVAVEFCIHIKRTDILFDSIFSKFVTVQHGGTFLEILEPYILKDMLGALPPEIMQALVEHYSSRGWLQRVEQCVLHMNISSLDFNQVVRLCREHGLYGALIYLFSRGLGDFRTPLEELLKVVQNNPKRDATAIGYRMLVYLKYSFEGLAFPPGHGTLDCSSLKSVRMELLQSLLEDSKSVSSQAFKSFKASSGTCPNLCHLLLLDTEATLEVLGCAFSDISIQHEEGDNLESLEPHDIMVQTTINKLINILDLESEVIRTFVVENRDEIWPSKKDIGHLLEFIAFSVSCKKTTISGRVLKHILEYLTSYDLAQHASNSTNIASQIEKQILILLKVVPQSDWNSDDLLSCCKNAQFYQACGFIHAIKGQYVAALDSYMKDQKEPYHTFAFIYNTLLHLKSTKASEFQSAVISRLPELVKLNRECTFFLVIDQFGNQSQDILSQLHSYPESLFLLLKSAIDVHLCGKLNFPVFETVQVSNTPFGKITNKLIELETYAERMSELPKLMHHNTIQITDELTELYLKLLCRFERKAVLKFLETFDNYRLEPCLRLCLEYEVTDAAAFLLERVGDVSSALVLLMTGLKEKIDSLVAAVENVFSETATSDYLGAELLADIIKMNEVAAVHDVLHAAVGLCQRNTQRLDSTESESLWFRLLDSYSEPLKRFCRSNGTEMDKESLSKWRHSYCLTVLRKLFSQFIGEIIEGMSGYVVLPVIMAKILSDNGTQEFGDFKLTIQRMLGTYGYERRILGTAKSLIEDDTFYTLSLLKKGASHAYAPQDFLCCICGCSLTKGSSTSQIRIFGCGHATHLHCESYEIKKDTVIGCPVCLPKSNVHSRSKSFFIGNGLVKKATSSSQTSEVIRNALHLHEPDSGEKSFGIQQLSRFEILSNLQKPRKTLQVEALPQLRLSPPAIYHEKIQHRVSSSAGDRQGDVSVKNERTNKRFQLKERKSRGPLNSFPLKSSIFGYEKNKVK